jgi:putative transcriptional regulator
MSCVVGASGSPRVCAPEPSVIEGARRRAGLTQTQAAELVHGSLRGWQQWEAGDRRMHPAFWELFLNKLGRDISNSVENDVEQGD